MMSVQQIADSEIAPTQLWSQPEAFLGVLLLVAVSDVQKHGSRLRAVEEYVRRSPFLRPLGEQGRAALHCSAARHLSVADALEQACAIVSPAMAPSLFAQALDLIIEAEPPSTQEEALMARLAVLLRIDAVAALRIREIITLKNKY